MSREGDNFQSSLEIDGVELSDTGDYACNVTNPVGFVERFNRLEVQGLFSYMAPTLLNTLVFLFYSLLSCADFWFKLQMWMNVSYKEPM